MPDLFVLPWPRYRLRRSRTRTLKAPCFHPASGIAILSIPFVEVPFRISDSMYRKTSLILRTLDIAAVLLLILHLHHLDAIPKELIIPPSVPVLLFQNRLS